MFTTFYEYFAIYILHNTIFGYHATNISHVYCTSYKLNSRKTEIIFPRKFLRSLLLVSLQFTQSLEFINQDCRELKSCANKMQLDRNISGCQRGKHRILRQIIHVAISKRKSLWHTSTTRRDANRTFLFVVEGAGIPKRMSHREVANKKRIDV